MSILSRARTASAHLRGRLRQQTGFWVPAREAFWLALEELRTHKLRSFLTLLGIVIATTTLIVVMSVVNGMNLYIATKIANLGTNTFVLHQFKWAQPYDEYLKALRRNRPIRFEEYEYLQDTLRGYEAISAIAQPQDGPEARYGGRSIDEVTLLGITASHAYIGREKVAGGATSPTRTTTTIRGFASLARTLWISSSPRSIRLARNWWWEAITSPSWAWRRRWAPPSA